MVKRVLAVTGIRSEYDVLYPVMDALRRDKNFEVKLAVSGAHLSDWHGGTLAKIEKDGFEIADKIDSLLMTDRKVQRVKGVALLAYALSQTVEREKPHFLLTSGDREESIATAIVGNYGDIISAHIGGGDPAYGHHDDPVRFAVSKLASIHFAITEQYAENLKRLGEEEFRIFNIGHPGIDNIKNTPGLSMKEISDHLEFDVSDKNYIVLIKHPLSSAEEDTGFQMRTTLEALEDFCGEAQYKVIGIYPNTDPGAYGIVSAMEEYGDKPFIKLYKTLPREVFVNLVRNAKGLIGNSSMGLVEAPFYRLPAVNVGNRQRGRLNAGNVEFVGYDKEEIKKALHKACFNARYRDHISKLDNPYGDGTAAQKVKDILLAIDVNDKRWRVKEKLC